MTKKERTLLFTICVIIYNIIIGLAIEAVLIVSLLFFLAENPKLAESVFTQVALPLLLLIGLIAAMSISVRSVGWAIRKFNLEDKLDPKVVSRYQKKL
ncbi:MAG: leader peptide processing enzyme [Treponema sp.]|uniref:leader peptide processing enzyme n=1 Tax=Treponema sp. TaxID=166 RepID=UPI001B59206E|nr:leader peptide processing enzyme [Treponema sp.]MBP3772316.1 leader peptide processing enzyme [Treponema sp.]MBQ9282443.1 leader peptide processing enzyme [Treponema sp.]